MKTSAVVFFSLILPLAVLGDEVPKGEKVEFKVYARPYFEKNSSGLMGDQSILVVADQATFDKIFGVGFVMGKKPDMLARDAFDKQIVLSVIRRGPLYTYSDVAVTAADGVLYVRYTVDSKGAGGTARFASPLIVAVNKGKWKSVIFLEGGDKKVGTVEIPK